MTPGITLVHKPVGITSFSLVREAIAAQAASGARRLPICHGGTLDPFASGLLLLLIGHATRLMDLHHAVPKRYLATVEWGSETDNGDPTGMVVESGDASRLTAEALQEAVGAFLGWRDQVPPATSAKKVGGEPAYRKVHRGEHVELPPSRVYLHEARFRSHALPQRSELELVCRGGYYVRALARDLGRALGCRAHLSGLRRTAIGPYEDPPVGVRVHKSGGDLLPWCRSRTLSDQELGELRQERAIPRGALAPPTWALPDGWPDPGAPIRAFHQQRLVGLLEQTAQGDLRAETFFRGGL